MEPDESSETEEEDSETLEVPEISAIVPDENQRQEQRTMRVIPPAELVIPPWMR